MGHPPHPPCTAVCTVLESIQNRIFYHVYDSDSDSRKNRNHSTSSSHSHPAPGYLHEPVEGEGVEHDEDGEGDEEVGQAVEVVEVILQRDSGA